MQKKSEQSEVIALVSRNLTLSAPRPNLSPREFSEFMESVRSKLGDAEASATAAMQSVRARLEVASNAFQSARGDVQHLQLEVGNKEKELAATSRDKERLHQELLGGSKKSLSHTSMAQAQGDYDDARKRFDEFMMTYNDKYILSPSFHNSLLNNTTQNHKVEDCFKRFHRPHSTADRGVSHRRPAFDDRAIEPLRARAHQLAGEAGGSGRAKLPKGAQTAVRCQVPRCASGHAAAFKSR